MTDPRRRFTGRAGDYARYRIGYPQGLIALLEERCGLTRESVVADLGSGTGALTRMLLDHGNPVFAIEPNREMRETAELDLAGHVRFVSIDATAEATTLPDRSVDLVTAGRALQWFDPRAAFREMARILRPAGRVVALWNRRLPPDEPVIAAYDRLLQEFCGDYGGSISRRQEAIALLESRRFHYEAIRMPKRFDLQQLKGHIRSLSISPDESHANYEPLMSAVEQMFEQHQQGGVLTIEYTTVVYYGRLQA